MGRETGFCFRDNRGLLGSKKDRAGKGHRTLRKHGDFEETGLGFETVLS